MQTKFFLEFRNSSLFHLIIIFNWFKPNLKYMQLGVTRIKVTSLIISNFWNTEVLLNKKTFYYVDAMIIVWFGIWRSKTQMHLQRRQLRYRSLKGIPHTIGDLSETRLDNVFYHSTHIFRFKYELMTWFKKTSTLMKFKRLQMKTLLIVLGC